MENTGGNLLVSTYWRFGALWLLLATACALAVSACGGRAPEIDIGVRLNQEITLTLHNWVDYMPQSVLDAFEAEYGIRVQSVIYESQDEAVANLHAGKAYDLVVLTVEYIPDLLAGGYIAELNHRNLRNVKNIPANFRDLAFDPGNRYAIPYHWGTTGLLVRHDLVTTMPTRWADLWDPQYAGKVAIWPIESSLLPIALKKLGFSANSEDRREVQAALDELRILRENAYIIGNDNATVIPDLAAGKAVLAYGWAYDALLAEAEGQPIQYVLPAEGSVLWSDYLMIPANAPHKAEAELFLNFLLRPEIGALLVKESYYPVANDAALPMIDRQLRENATIYPPPEDLAHAEMTLPLSPAGKHVRAAAWAEFLSAP
jgi:spermidine/putrescine transport system substrate-binding protein